MYQGLGESLWAGFRWGGEEIYSLLVRWMMVRCEEM